MRTYLLAAIFAVQSGIGLAAEPAHSLAEDAAAFGARESISSIDLSPSGNSLVFISPALGTDTVALSADVGGTAAKPFLHAGNQGEQLSWCTFVTDDRLICRYRGMGTYEGILAPYSRLIAVSRDGSKVEQLGQRPSFYDSGLRQFDASVLDWLPGQKAQVLLARNFVPEEGRSDTRIVRKAQGLGVDRIDVFSLRSTVVERPRPDVSDYFSDGQGNVRLLAVDETTNEGLLTGRVKYDYRTQGSSEWRELTAYAKQEDFIPLAIDADANALYVLKPLDGRRALYRIRLTETPSPELVASNPRVDVDDVVRLGRSKRVIGYTFAEDKRETVYFDPQIKALAAGLGRALPQLPIIRFDAISDDGNKFLIFAGSDSDPGRYYLFDKATKHLNELMLARPELENRKLAAVQTVQVDGPDGVKIPAYLTLPPSGVTKGLPAVVLPHGGPSARDEWGFDWLAQFLASRGYAVLQPNFRGSAGFGDHWLAENGFKSWKTSIGDVTASARWLAQQGYADASKLAVVGWSYGGYAALQSSITDPALFKAVVAIAPVTDLALVKEHAKDYTSSRMVAEFVGSGPHILQGSPLRRAAEVHVPVLLVHGTRDQNATVDQSDRMADALREHGTPVELLRFEGLDHQLQDSAARTQMLTRIAELLDRTIGH